MSSIRSTYAYALDKAPKATFARTGLGVLLELVIVAGELADADPNEMCTRYRYSVRTPQLGAAVIYELKGEDDSSSVFTATATGPF